MVDVKRSAPFGVEDPLKLNVQHFTQVVIHFLLEDRAIGLYRLAIGLEGGHPIGE